MTDQPDDQRIQIDETRYLRRAVGRERDRAVMAEELADKYGALADQLQEENQQLREDNKRLSDTVAAMQSKKELPSPTD